MNLRSIISTLAVRRSTRGNADPKAAMPLIEQMVRLDVLREEMERVSSSTIRASRQVVERTNLLEELLREGVELVNGADVDLAALLAWAARAKGHL